MDWFPPPGFLLVDPHAAARLVVFVALLMAAYGLRGRTWFADIRAWLDDDEDARE